ncbi:O-antigen/teichoic acid export membrane protein [Sphingomonas naasensis]|uniref:Lipopolysaccharide biosynthesis protein n=1 Tax=Sphingomonas naasensis TaxID=1344951 RepID=A0A4S1WST9_9SPHN|nr:lipopolysaccharide biosynthesis protein [Sphingomonas naasensis]NIJ19304.1 O-antigen/teichoic acid export membrane protein [Sphingomonas naasensis]TGX46479.1 lipopolysaccharide biosynthesis protein [Sphingomonas naasensis]
MVAGNIRFLLKRMSVYGVSGVLSRVSGLVTFPILTKAMGAEQFGTLDYYVTIVNLVAAVAVFGLDSVGNRFYFQSDNLIEKRRTMSQIVSIQAVPMALLFAAGIFMFGALPYPQGMLLGLVFWQAALAALISHIQYLMIWNDDKYNYLISTVGQTLLTMALLAWICLSRSPSAGEVLAIFFAARLATVLHGAYATKGMFGLTLDRQGLGAMLRYGWPIGIICALNAIMPFIERQSIVSLLTESDLGRYAAAGRIAILLTLPISAFQIVWVPFAFSHFREPGAEGIYRLVLKLFAIFGVAAALAVTAIAVPLLKILTTNEFLDGRTAVFPICLGLVVKGLGDIAQVGIDISLKSHLKLITYGVMTALALLLTPLLTHMYGIAGAAWGTVISFSVKTLVEYRLAQSAHPIEWHGNRILLVAMLGLLLGIGAELAKPLAPDATMFAAAGGALIVLACGWTLVLDAEERRHLIELVPKYHLRRQGAND